MLLLWLLWEIPCGDRVCFLGANSLSLFVRFFRELFGILFVFFRWTGGCAVVEAYMFHGIFCCRRMFHGHPFLHTHIVPPPYESVRDTKGEFFLCVCVCWDHVNTCHN
jgi:hypothetical protein